MLLSAASAKALAAIVLFSIVGPQEATARLPLRIESDGAYWIVRGRTSPQPPSRTILRGFHVYIDKATAEMRELAAIDMRPFEIPPETLQTMRQSGWRPLKRGALGLPLDPSPSALPPELTMFAYHGVLSTPTAAIAYARVLMRASARFRSAASGSLQAQAHDNIWHIAMKVPDQSMPKEIMRVSQINGKVMSGML